MLDVGEERVVPRSALEMAVAHALVHAHQRRRYLLRLPRREQDVVLIRHDEDARLDERERRVERTEAVARIVQVHRTRYVQVGVRVEAAHELHRLVVEVALDLEVRLEEPVALRAVLLRRLDEVLLEVPLELLLQELAREVRDVRKLARRREAGPRTLPVALEVVVSALPLRIVGDGVAAHHAEGYRLRVEVRARRDEAHLVDLVGIARHPVDDLEPAVTSAHERRESLHAELVQEHPEDVDGIVKGVLRELRAIGFARVGIDRHGARRPLASA